MISLFPLDGRLPGALQVTRLLQARVLNKPLLAWARHGIAVVVEMLNQTQMAHPMHLTGVYGRVRHPQYVGFIVILLGFLLKWPTILTLLMFPALVVMYVRLAHAEETEARLKFGDAYVRYAARVPGWLPRPGGRVAQGGPA